jgi:aryl-alcohol dehydrogenase-like predicted oxidoreductase
LAGWANLRAKLKNRADLGGNKNNFGRSGNMDYVKFGRTGLGASRLCIGCMTYGIPNRGAHPWTLDEEQSRPLIKQAVELGINFFDTANVYSDGTSEEILGRALKEFTRREDVVIATKVNGRMRPGPNGAGLSRKAIFGELHNSLRRLGTDFVDLYQIHRWDPTVPVEETMEALHDVVKAGKVRYIGASSMYAWQFSKALYTSRLRGWTEFVSMQSHINLLNREEEREMLPLCADQGIAVMPWSPLARGRLTRAWNETSSRQETDEFGKKLYTQFPESDRLIVDQVSAVATARGVPRAQVALAWLLQKKGVTSPIVGASKPDHLKDAVAALSLKLTADEIASLELPYVPHGISGF